MDALVEYLAYFHGNRDYFHCHDILEEHWKTLEPLDKQSVFVGLIQLAVGLYHYRAKQYAGAEKMLRNALRIFHRKIHSVYGLGFDGLKMIVETELVCEALRSGKPFRDVNLPIADTALELQALKRCLELGFDWRSATYHADDEIVYKHRLRDRSNVIAERQMQLTLRKEKKQAN